MVEGQLRDRVFRLFYTTRTRVRSRYRLTSEESMRNEEKKCLNKQCNPMYLQGVRTIMKSDSAGPQVLVNPGRWT